MFKSKNSMTKFLAITITAAVATACVGMSTLTAFAEEASDANMSDTYMQEPVQVMKPEASTEAIVISDYFSSKSGDGLSEETAIVIENADQFINIGVLSNSMITTYYYFRLDADIELDERDSSTTLPTYITTYFHGQLDGNDKIITSASNSTVWLSNGTLEEADFKDFEIYQQDSSSFFSLTAYSGGYYYTDAAKTIVTFTNITVLGSVSVLNNASSFAGLAFGKCYFNNCLNIADIYITGYAGIFIGGYTNNSYVSFIDCVNEGNVYGAKVGFFNGNTFGTSSSFILSDSEDFSDITDDGGYSVAYVSGCANEGTIKGYTSCSPFASNNGESYNAAANDNLGDRFEAGEMTQDENSLSSATAVIVDNEGINQVKFSNVSTAQTNIVSIYAQTSAYDSNGDSVMSSYVWIDITLDTTNTINCISRIIGSKEWNDLAAENNYPTYDNIDCEELTDSYGGNLYKTYTVDGNTIVIVSTDSMKSVLSAQLDGTIVASVTLDSTDPTYTINAYSSDSEVLGSKTFKYSEILAASTSSTNE